MPSTLMVARGAAFSPCRTWRYRLTRYWDLDRPQLNVIGLNPSTADEHQDDPTIRRVIGFAQREGFGRLEVTNLFALRSTNPAALRRAADPVGPQNDVELRHAAESADAVCIAWGANPMVRSRTREQAVLNLLSGIPLWCLGTTRDGSPRHPLYLANATELVRYG